VFFAPFVPFFDPRIGRPSTPMQTYLRLVFLKFRYRMGFVSLCPECRIRSPGGSSAGSGSISRCHPTTLMKLTTRCGSSAVVG